MTTGPAAPASPTRTRVRRVLRVLWILACLVAVGLVIASEGPATAEALSRLTAGALLGSLGLALVGVALSAGLWNAALRQLGGRLGWAAIARLFFPSQIGKYLPGGLWPVLAHATQASQHGLTATVGAGAFGWFLWLHLTTGSALGVLFLAVAGPLPPVLGVASLPLLALGDVHVAGWVNHVLTRLTRERVRLPIATAARAERLRWAIWAVAMWACYGLHLAVLVAALGTPISVPVAIGAFAASWTIGFLTLVAPAGAGAREVALVAILSPLTGAPVAVAAAAVSRLLLVVADGLWAALGVALGLRARGRRAGQAGDAGAPHRPRVGARP